MELTQKFDSPTFPNSVYILYFSLIYGWYSAVYKYWGDHFGKKYLHYEYMNMIIDHHFFVKSLQSY